MVGEHFLWSCPSDDEWRALIFLEVEEGAIILNPPEYFNPLKVLAHLSVTHANLQTTSMVSYIVVSLIDKLIVG